MAESRERAFGFADSLRYNYRLGRIVPARVLPYALQVKFAFD